VVDEVIMLSVIVPFFNVEQYAAKNLRSLARNAATGIEFVLVDDGSTDATSACQAVCQRRNDHRSQPFSAASTGVYAAPGSG
jgi:glycosyltransferase involved in cell wall biosynthesis